MASQIGLAARDGQGPLMPVARDALANSRHDTAMMFRRHLANGTVAVVANFPPLLEILLVLAPQGRGGVRRQSGKLQKAVQLGLRVLDKSLIADPCDIAQSGGIAS